jgi:hypothetical protein
MNLGSIHSRRERLSSYGNQANSEAHSGSYQIEEEALPPDMFVTI